MGFRDLKLDRHLYPWMVAGALALLVFGISWGLSPAVVAFFSDSPRVLRFATAFGMGLIVLHSGHFSKVFKRLMGTGCDLKWRESTDKERLWVVNPAHPIAQGVGEYIELASEEMYGEHFDIPAPGR